MRATWTCMGTRRVMFRAGKARAGPAPGPLPPRLAGPSVVFVFVGLVFVDLVVEQEIALVEHGLLHQIVEREPGLVARSELLALELLDGPVASGYAHGRLSL